MSDDKQTSFLRLTPAPKPSSTTPPTIKPASTPTTENASASANATTACPCAYCAKHGSPDAGANHTAEGMKALSNCACSPCSSPGEEASSEGEGFEMLPGAAMGVPDAVEEGGEEGLE